MIKGGIHHEGHGVLFFRFLRVFAVILLGREKP